VTAIASLCPAGTRAAWHAYRRKIMAGDFERWADITIGKIRMIFG